MLEKFDAGAVERLPSDRPRRMRRHAFVWLGAGTRGVAGGLAHELRASRSTCWCLPPSLTACSCSWPARCRRENAFTSILDELESMSASMRWLALVQFFSWFSLFTIFVYTAPAVAKLHFGATSPGSPAYEAGANWVGVLFATYNGLGALAALDPAVLRAALRHAHARTRSICGSAQPVVVDDADPRSRLAAGIDGRPRLRLGVHHRACPTPCSPTTCRRERWA